MRLFRLASLLPFCLLFSLSSAAQQPPPRDPQALVVLQRALAAMGGVVPSDSVATGTVVLVAGSKTETGTIRILTRGLNQSAEQIQTPEGTRAEIYSRGLAGTQDGTSSKRLSLELAATSQSPAFPLALIAAALNNPDCAFQYLGLETLDGLQAYHLRFWNTYLSNQKLQALTQFTVKDLWIDAGSALPHKLSYQRRAAAGGSPRIAVEVVYSDYRSIGGVVYPFVVRRSLNGTPWATITIGSVLFNTPLSDTDFPVR